jgi:hypothetical protein
MRVAAVSSALAGLVVIAACDGPNTGVDASRSAAPTAVNCADASGLRQQALDARRQREETSSDQTRIVAGNRASFFASLATIADLKCRGTLPEADEALKPALEAARKAEAADSFYERAAQWTEASYIAAQVVGMLTKRLAADK